MTPGRSNTTALLALLTGLRAKWVAPASYITKSRGLLVLVRATHVRFLEVAMLLCFLGVDALRGLCCPWLGEGAARVSSSLSCLGFCPFRLAAAPYILI